MKQLICVFLCFTMIILQATQVIMLMGPSCAGKSTLSKFLCKKLIEKDEPWVVIDFDEVGENIEQLIATVNQYLEENINVIIDTNTYENDMESCLGIPNWNDNEVGAKKKFIGAIAVTKVIVTAPLVILLQRDEKRTKHLQRNEPRAFWARQFVIESFNKSLTWPSDIIIDSFTQSVQESCEIILNSLFKV